LKPGIQNINFEIDVSYCKKNMIIWLNYFKM
jgi:hypothetical protein